jgi:hypothetical protein
MTAAIGRQNADQKAEAMPGGSRVNGRGLAKRLHSHAEHRRAPNHRTDEATRPHNCREHAEVIVRDQRRPVRPVVDGALGVLPHQAAHVLHHLREKIEQVLKKLPERL